MKKQSKRMNARAIKRKMGIDRKQMDNMLKDIRNLVDGEVFQKGEAENNAVTIDKTKLMTALKEQMNLLEKEWGELKHDVAFPLPDTKPIEKKDIKINIS